MAALDVLPLAAAKLYLNIPASSTVNDAELAADFIPPAVERVEQHLWGRDSDRHLAPGAITALQLLACKVVLSEYWRTQRHRRANAGGGSSAAAIEADASLAGTAPLTRRLAELLGPAADDDTERPPAPTGSFPPAEGWPDPPLGCLPLPRWWRW